jgi:hypothetical protein
VVIVTPTDMFKSTAKAMAPPGLVKRMQTDTPEQRRERVAEGLLELVDSSTAVAQTPERVCTVAQPVRLGVYVGQPQVMFVNQAQFDGRLKMFGAKMGERDREAIAEFREALERHRRERTQ